MDRQTFATFDLTNLSFFQNCKKKKKQKGLRDANSDIREREKKLRIIRDLILGDLR